MEATALSVGKSVLDGALGYAKSALAEEVALQLGVQRDHAFIREELQMMQAFLMAAHDDQDKHKILMVWVKQVRDVAYDAEDCLQDFSVYLKDPSWWRLPKTLRERRRIAKQLKELRARVEDVSQRNLRYQLTKSSISKTATVDEMSSVTAETVFGVDQARRASRQEPKEDLVHLINKEGEDLRVIALWGTSGDLGLTTIINAAYENTNIIKKFSCRAWIRILHPFNPSDFIQCLLKQFRSTEGIDILLEKEKTENDLAMEFTRYVNQKSYLIVLNDLSTFEEWKVIKTFFPSSKKGSRIIVCAPQVEIASLCAGQENRVVELKKLSVDQTIYGFFEKDSLDGMKLPLSISDSNEATTCTNNPAVLTKKVLGNQCNGENEINAVTKCFTRIKSMASTSKEYQIIDRKVEKSKMIQLLSCEPINELQVISVWGMGGLGKTTLAKDVFESQEIIAMFEKRVFVTLLHPFILKELLESLITGLILNEAIDLRTNRGNIVESVELDLLVEELDRLIEGNNCLIVLDDLSSTTEWDHIIGRFPKLDGKCRILVTTREHSIAKHCCKKHENIYKLKVLEDKEALDLFTKKVLKDEAINWDECPELFEAAQLILKKCDGLPLAIVTIGGFLANQPKIAVEWRKLIEHISAELEMNQELEPIKTILGKSYDGLPYHLKSCFLYMSIFPEDYKIRRRRLIRRWVAEGYSREIHEKPAEEVSDTYFVDLVNRSMILPSKKSVYSRQGIDSCQVHDLMREISISKSTEENLVFRLEEGCSSNTHQIFRHLAINSNWKGDKVEYESAVDLSRIRSLTVFGEWRSFYISKKMRLLRVLDLESTTGLLNHHLEHIGSLLHLKYISLRGCDGIYYLPNSWGNLLQLETLDIKGTRICVLPHTIIKLRKLQHLFGGDLEPRCVFPNDIIPAKMKDLCLACCAPKYLKDVEGLDGDLNSHDVCTFWWHVVFPTLASRRLDPWGIILPKGVRKLKSLCTLGLVNLTGRKTILHDIRRLNQLRKLKVYGIDKKNCQEFCSALEDLNRLESLSVNSTYAGDLHGLLDGLSTPPSNLQILKLTGKLVELPEWIWGLHNLVKLTLFGSELTEVDSTMQALGELPNLAFLRLGWNSFMGNYGLTFHQKAFPSLMMLHILDPQVMLLEFQNGSTPKLEVLRFGCFLSSLRSISGLASLPSLKEVMLQGNYGRNMACNLADQLVANPNGPVLKMISATRQIEFRSSSTMHALHGLSRILQPCDSLELYCARAVKQGGNIRHRGTCC